jgi:uncharacterized protein YsxB (DUF464 family)
MVKVTVFWENGGGRFGGRGGDGGDGGDREGGGGVGDDMAFRKSAASIADKPRIKSIRVEGHAGFGKYGKDIVCAAASVTAYTAAGALAELAGFDGCYAERDGYFEIALPEAGTADGDKDFGGSQTADGDKGFGGSQAADGDKGFGGSQGAADGDKRLAGAMRTADVIMETAYIGYRMIAESYPKHLKLKLVCR